MAGITTIPNDPNFYHVICFIAYLKTLLLAGVYTVPTSGDYVVMMHALSELNGQLWLDLYRNDDYLISAYAHTTAQYATASNVGVVRFNASDLLHVKGHGDSILYGYSDEVYTTLSAYLLYASKN